MACCEYGAYPYPKTTRCRKKATIALGYRYEWGKRVSMNGPDTPMYQDRVTKVCSIHSKEAPQGDIIGTLPLDEYIRLTAVKDTARGMGS